ncbi:MAG: glycerol-3-phosphate 1-O-acyltransferase PlsY [Nitrospinota bacterium]|nr:glycerol-3-phosphate 1-O-acyltransferase PlsY [Nitrospinota bacterium]
MDAPLIWVMAYLLGAIPCGVLVARAKNINIREHGSGNIGATNVARILGKKDGALTLAGDCSKGLIAAVAAAHTLDHPAEIAWVGLFAVAGHSYSVFLKFKGGKGVATGLGVFIYLMPLAAFSSIAVFVATLGISRYVSIGSMLGALSLPLFGLLFKMPLPYLYSSMTIALFIIFKHHENIQRLFAGTESKLLKK